MLKIDGSHLSIACIPVYIVTHKGTSLKVCFRNILDYLWFLINDLYQKNLQNQTRQLNLAPGQSSLGLCQVTKNVSDKRQTESEFKTHALVKT